MLVTMDWGIGNYERQSDHLRPAVEQAIAAVAAGPGEFVVDVGCGAGNAALLVAAGGARVTGVDPAPRLLEVARTEARRRGVSAEFVVGDAANLPIPDGTADAVVSTFALIFAPDPVAALQEIARVLKPGGRLVFTAWLHSGGLAQQSDLARRLLVSAPAPHRSGANPEDLQLEVPVRGGHPEISQSSARGTSQLPEGSQGAPDPGSAADPGQPHGQASTSASEQRTEPFGWSDPAVVANLASGLGFSPWDSRIGSLAFLGESPQAAAEAELANHPRWVNVRRVLEPAGRWEEARARIVRSFAEVNEDPAAYRLTSSYVLHTLVRDEPRIAKF